MMCHYRWRSNVGMSTQPNESWEALTMRLRHHRLYADHPHPAATRPHSLTLALSQLTSLSYQTSLSFFNLPLELLSSLATIPSRYSPRLNMSRRLRPLFRDQSQGTSDSLLRLRIYLLRAERPQFLRRTASVALLGASLLPEIHCSHN